LHPRCCATELNQFEIIKDTATKAQCRLIAVKILFLITILKANGLISSGGKEKKLGGLRYGPGQPLKVP